MSAPWKIWTYPNGHWGSEKLAWPTAHDYHHDDVVRELVEALEPLAHHPAHEDSAMGRRARSALAKISQEG